MANGDGVPWHENVPQWAKTFAFLVGTVGMPVLVSAYFMAMNVGVLNSPASRNEVALGRVENSITLAVKSMESAVGRRDLMQEKLLHVQVQTCRNAAKTEQQTRDCDYWRK